METISVILSSDLFFGWWSLETTLGVAYMITFALTCEYIHRKFDRLKQLKRI